MDDKYLLAKGVEAWAYPTAKNLDIRYEALRLAREFLAKLAAKQPPQGTVK